MDISKEHIASKKVIGKLKNIPVIQLKTTGGLCLIVKATGDALGVGSHQGIARYIAEKKEPDIEWTEISKSDELPFECFEFLLPQYEEMTDMFRAMQGING